MALARENKDQRGQNETVPMKLEKNNQATREKLVQSRLNVDVITFIMLKPFSEWNCMTTKSSAMQYNNDLLAIS